MRAFGYTRGDDEAEAPTELREVSFLCSTLDELRRLQAFIGDVIAARSAHTPAGGGSWHEHLRDRDPRWTKDESDVILVMHSAADTQAR